MRKVLLLFLLLSITAGASFIYPFPRQVCLRRADLVVLGEVVSESPGPDVDPEPSRFLYVTPPVFRNNTKYDRPGKLGLLRVERWLKGAPREEVRVIYSAQESYLNKGNSVWMLQWNEACKAYQFDLLFGPRVKDVPDLEKILKAQAEQPLLDDHHGVKYLIQPLNSLDGFGRDVEIETVLEGDLSHVRLEVSADGHFHRPETAQ
ncbi:hypothetical protein JST97_33040 [bacterium]|nr:hypothetical protein [bacterium]